jgi:polyvinyl alcohol dehydrogenase (cytochrome)
METSGPLMRRARRVPVSRTLLVLSGMAVLAAGCSHWRPPHHEPPPPPAASWTMFGKDANNSRNAVAEKAISPATAANLKVKWSIDTAGDVSASPAVADGVLYFPDYEGWLYAADAKTGALRWKKKISDYTGNPASQSRNTPIIYGDWLIFGEIKGHTHEVGGGDEHDHEGEGEPGRGDPTPTTTTVTTPTTATTSMPPMGDHDHAMAVDAPPPPDEHGDGDDHGTTTTTEPGTPAPPTGANIFAVKKSDGSLVWKTLVESHPATLITSNPVLAGDSIVVGVSSLEEALAASGTYPCCGFGGSVVKLNAKTGHLDWKFHTLPPNPTDKRCAEYDAANEKFGGCADSGGAVWNTPAVDLGRKAVYFGTGNNYTVTDEEWQCARDARANNQSDANCTAPDNHIESIISLDLGTGQIKWAKKLGGFDAWNYQCLVNPGNTWCPSPYGEDFDFGATTNLFAGGGKDLVGVGQKSGIYWALNRDTGEVVWNTLAGPGAALGGIEWGTSFDAQRIYIPEANFGDQEYTLASGEATKQGSWAALDKATGKIQWQTLNPSTVPKLGPMGATTVANGVVFGGTTLGDGQGENMFAFDAATGQILWNFQAAGSVNSGPSVVDGTVFWGSGYMPMESVGMTAGRKLYAFSVNGS